jgi:hypothetical protein
MIPDPEIAGAGGRDVPKAYLGPVTYSGEHNFYVRSEALPLALYGVLGGGGGAPTGSGTAGYVHTFTPADTLPFFTLQEQVANSFDTFKYTDTYFDSLKLECAADGYMMGTLGLAARQQDAGQTPATPAFDATPMYVGSNITITYNAVTVQAQSFTFEYKNNLEKNHFILGSLLVDAMTPKRRDITGTFALRPQANTFFRQAMYGNSSATTPTGLPTAQQLIITATTYEIITGATSQVYTTTITLPEVELLPFKPTATGDNVLEHSIDFRVVKIAASNAATVAVTNGVATAYNT